MCVYAFIFIVFQEISFNCHRIINLYLTWSFQKCNARKFLLQDREKKITAGHPDNKRARPVTVHLTTHLNRMTSFYHTKRSLLIALYSYIHKVS